MTDVTDTHYLKEFINDISIKKKTKFFNHFKLTVNSDIYYKSEMLKNEDVATYVSN